MDNVFHSRLFTLGLLSASMFIGCSNVSSELSKPTEVVTWPALQALQSPDIHMGIIRSAQMNDMKGLKAHASDPKLDELVKKLEDEPIPSKFASKAREDAKKQLVGEYRALISGAKGMASGPDMKRTVQSITESLTKITDPALK